MAKQQSMVGTKPPGSDLSPDESILARGLLGWPQVRLAARSNVSEGTIRDFEGGKRVLRPRRIAAIRAALETAGVMFTAGGPLLKSNALPVDPRRRSRAELGRGRTQPLKGEDAEVNHVVETHGITSFQARELVRRHGDDWRKIDEAAKPYQDEDE